VGHRTYTIEVIDEIWYTYEWQNPGVDLPHDTPFHGFVVQIWDVRGAHSNILLDIAVIGSFDFGRRHLGDENDNIRRRGRFVDSAMLRRLQAAFSMLRAIAEMSVLNDPEGISDSARYNNGLGRSVSG
jgi:hypothetical protein